MKPVYLLLIIVLVVTITTLYFNRKKFIENFADDDSGQPYGIWNQDQIDSTFNKLGSNLDDLTGKYSRNSSLWDTKIGSLEQSTVGMERNISELSDNMARDFVILHKKGQEQQDQLQGQASKVSALDGNFAQMSSHVGDIDKKLLDIQSTNTSNYTLLNAQITNNSQDQKKFINTVNSNLQGFNDNVSSKFADQAKITSNLSGSINQFNNLLNSTNTSLDTQTKVINNLQGNLATFHTSIDYITNNYAVSGDVKNLQNSLSALSDALPKTYAKNTDIGPLSGQISGITSSLNTLQGNLSSLTGIVTTIQGSYVNQNSITNLANTINLAQNSINDVKNLVNTINTNYATQNDIAGLKSSIIAQESSISALTASLGNDQAAINNLKSLSASLSSVPSQSNIGLLQSSLSNLTTTVATNTSNINGMNAAIQNNAGAITNINTNLSSLKTTVDNLNTTVANFQASATNSYASKSDLSQMNTTLQAQIKLLQNVSNSTSSTLSQLKTDKLQLGNKWLFSGVGDHDGNDNWLRMFDSSGGDYSGGIAMAQLWTRDNSWLNGNTNVTGPLAATGPTNQLRDSWLPYTDGNSYIRAGSDGKVINIGDYYNNDVNLGKPNTNVNLRGNVNTPGTIQITNDNPGGLVERNYGSKDDRYGVGLMQGGQAKVYTSTKYQPANVSLSFAKPDGTYLDALTATQDGKMNPTTTINNQLNANNVNYNTIKGGDLYANNTKLSGNWSGYADNTAGASEIANDMTGSKQLMIVGNRAGGAERRVGVWDTLNVNGTLNANGPINTPAGIHVNNGDPGPLIDKNYGTNDNRYGIGQFPGGQTRVYTAGGAYQPAGVNLSIGKPDGSFIDAVNVSKDGNLNPTTTVNGGFKVNGTSTTGDLYANNTKMSGNWSGYPDGNANGSEIANDTNQFKQLMLVGNRSGGGNRQVGVWDTLNVNGTLNRNGNVYQNGGTQYMNDRHTKFRGDENHGVGYDGSVDGPNLYGWSGGKLATTNGTTALQWDNSGKVTVPQRLQLGNKWLLSGVTDGQNINDDWLRFLGAGDPKNYYGGGAFGKVWSATNYQTSDENLKDNIQPLTQQDLDDLDRLAAKSYNLKDDATKKQKFGFVSQDVEKVYPNLVTKSGPEGQQGLDYTGLIAPIVANVQELKRKVNSKEICIDDVCFDVNEFKRLKNLLQNQA